MKTPSQKPQDEEWVDPYPKKKGISWFKGIILLVVVYVLSSGPAAFLDSKGIISGKVFSLIYWPLLAVTETFIPAQRALLWYVGLWKSLG